MAGVTRIGYSALIILWTMSGALASEIILKVVPQGQPGQPVQVEIQGSTEPGDFITVAEPDSGAAEFINYARVQGDGPVSLQLPETTGQYVVRYVSPSQNLSVVAQVAVEVRDASALVSAPEQAQSGDTVTIGVSDPGDPADFLTVVSDGAESTDIGPYVRLRGNTSVELLLDLPPGHYEVRHMRASGMTILARAPIEITPGTTVETDIPKITEEQPRTAVTDSEQPTQAANVSTHFGGDSTDTGAGSSGQSPVSADDGVLPGQTGQDNKADVQAQMLAEITKAAAADRDAGTAALSKMIEDLARQASEETDDPAMQAAMAAAVEAAADAANAMNSKSAAQALAMVETSATRSIGGAGREMSLVALDAVDVGSQFHVVWEGSGMPGDRITILPLDAPGGTPTGAMVMEETAVKVFAPPVAGLYEIIYQDALTGQSLASREIEVR